MSSKNTFLFKKNDYFELLTSTAFEQPGTSGTFVQCTCTMKECPLKFVCSVLLLVVRFLPWNEILKLLLISLQEPGESASSYEQ